MHITNHYASQKVWRIFLVLIAIVASQWLVNTNTRMLPSLMLRFSSKRSVDENYSGRIQDRVMKEQVAFESTTSNPKTLILIHYHKTGNNFVVDLLKQIHRTKDRHQLAMKERSVLRRMNKNKKRHLQRGKEKSDEKMIGADGVDDDAIGDERMLEPQDGIYQEGNKTVVLLPMRRSHDRGTGCPILGDKGFQIGAAYRLSAPSFFCNLSMAVDDQSELPFPAWETTKIIHFVRDPIDMALSNYLYHSQYPTPEPWVKRRDINPCHTDDQFLNFTVKKLNAYSGLDAGKITMEDLKRVTDMCQYYNDEHPVSKTDHPNKTRSFYGIMRRLPHYDGLQFATSHFLMAQSVQSGGDLLRMANNILRLQEWDVAG